MMHSAARATVLAAWMLLVAFPMGRWALSAQMPVDSALRPRFSGGVVWIRSLPLSPRELASRLTGKRPEELLDSTITAITTQYLEAVEAARRAEGGAAPPSWTTGSGNAKLGLDSRYVYLGPLKLPTILLGLLPISLPVNPTARDRERTLGSMLEDLRIAGARQATLADFAEGVKEVRREREAQRIFEANQRRPPPELKDST